MAEAIRLFAKQRRLRAWMPENGAEKRLGGNEMAKQEKKKKKERVPFRTQWKQAAAEKKGMLALYIILRVMVIAVMIAQFFNGDYNNVFLCLLTLVLFTIPAFVEGRLKIDVPDTLEVIILLFIFSAEILGEIREYYLTYPYWDTMLHTINGFLMAAIGFSLIDILNRSERFAIKMSPFFVALFAFCFSMTIGVLWEFYEFGADVFLKMDMQKDTVLQEVTSVALNPQGRNVPVTVPVKTLSVNGEEWNLGGYLDVGLHDTMADLIVNFIGALVFSVIGMFYIKGRGSGKFVRRFIPTRKAEPAKPPRRR